MIQNIIRELIPPLIYKKIKNFRKSQVSRSDSNYYCPVCNKEVNSFLRLPVYYDDMMDKYGFIHSPFQFETLNRTKYFCPHCYVSDRNRLYALYLNQKYKELKKTNKRYSLLDVAPDKILSDRILKDDFINYRSVDMFMDGVDDRADITNLDIYESNKFDIIICSHVFEHVTNDIKAMSELYRVMKIGGFGIFMVPILLTLEEDFENDQYDSPELHWKYYGQDDHVRIYSKKGYIEKLTNVGFTVNQMDINYFGEDVYMKNGIHPRSVLYIVEK